VIHVSKINHAVLMVRDLDRSVAFYHDALGLEEIARAGGRMAFMRAPGSANHHDLGFLALGPRAKDPSPEAVGLFHLAWEVPNIEDLVAIREKLTRLGTLEGASDHGATKSLYGKDPDGNEFEVMWLVPRELWGDYEKSAPTGPLDLEAEVRRFGKAGAR
jgi:catechol-2,3-dioxygenase